MRFSTAFEWLDWIGSIHITEIELGLDRVKEVAARLGVLTPSCPVIIVGGTNGKGSTVAGLESIYCEAGYRTGAFTSPYLFKHNEQVRIDGKHAEDQEFCAAFEKIEDARGNISLTPFEFHTLAALLIFKQYPIDVLILEVGLGGRLDAVNIIDADVSVVTSISIDHIEWLGNTREQIAHEKAGIFREDRPAVCGDIDPPQSLLADAANIGAKLFRLGQEFQYQEQEQKTTWSWSSQQTRYDELPPNTLATQNMATVLMVVTLLQDRLPVQRDAIERGLLKVNLPGRIQVIEGDIQEIFDVSHNQASIALLAKRLGEMPCTGKTHAVFSMLRDKDIVESIHTIANRIDTWHVAPLTVKRAADLKSLQAAFAGIEVSWYSSIEAAYEGAKKIAVPGDRVVVFGSFHTVADVMCN